MIEPDQEEAIAKIQLLRGDVAISVNLSWCTLDDAALECLKGLPQLRELYLSHTDVSDAGLEHLKGLRQLQTLDLRATKVTDAGLEHLKGLEQLQTLDLGGTKVTDAGLEHLKGLRHEIKERRPAEELSLKDQRYLRYLLELQDRDRQMVSYEIHDGLVPQLAAAIMQLEAFSRLAGRGDNEVWKSFETGLQRLNDCMREARQLISGLRSPILDEFGVVAAVEDLISQDSTRDKPKIDFVHHLDCARLAPSLENAVYRIVQESLTNARRYSQSERVLVRLTQRGRHIRIEVRDWGIGFNPREVGEGHFGLEGIRKRARLFGGSATIKSTLGKGTRIVVQLPLVGGVGRGPEKPPCSRDAKKK